MKASGGASFAVSCFWLVAVFNMVSDILPQLTITLSYDKLRTVWAIEHLVNTETVCIRRRAEVVGIKSVLGRQSLLFSTISLTKVLSSGEAFISVTRTFTGLTSRCVSKVPQALLVLEVAEENLADDKRTIFRRKRGSPKARWFPDHRFLRRERVVKERVQRLSYIPED